VRLATMMLASLVGCSSTPSPERAPRRSTALGALMNETVNPTFSKMIAYAFHADTMDAEPAAIRAELRRAADDFRAAFARVKTWSDPPVDSAQGRDVFYTYAADVDRLANELVVAIDRADDAAVRRSLERVAGTCNACHHFFRLHIEDSVIPQ
jgi:cytochrome c556